VSPQSLELVIVIGDAVTVASLPPSGSLTLGRGEDCEIRIDSRAVSRRHATLHLGPGPTLRLQDLGSANGTFVRDARSPVDPIATQPLRKLSRELFEISIGERISLGSIPVVVRRARSVSEAPATGVVVRDPAMLALHEQLGRAARSPISVLLLGETGVGKEVLARAVHDRSPRSKGPYLELNCAALPPSLLEGELFGHEKNAFTGAATARPGLFESADGGTIFLDEIGELPMAVQIKLLRVLEDRKVMRLGGRTSRALDVRFVAATNRDLEAEIARGTFRQDLFFRLNGVCFVIPPLRERPSEIGPLAEQFLAAAAHTLDRRTSPHLSEEALGYLVRYAWPGNVRELRNVLDRAAVLTCGEVILPEDLPAHVTGVSNRAPAAAPMPTPMPMPTPTPMPAPASSDIRTTATPPDPPSNAASVERQRIIDALEQCAGNQTRAAKLLGISLRTLVNRLSAHDLPRPRRPSR
jgi:two-component system, NtrC family, response regulator AtoC